jgi:hypothetical protein
VSARYVVFTAKPLKKVRVNPAGAVGTRGPETNAVETSRIPSFAPEPPLNIVAGVADRFPERLLIPK